MADIFDQVAAPPAATGGTGDIFDQVAKPSTPPATAAPVAPPPDKTDVPDASTVAGAGPAGIPQPAAHPAVDMKPSALSNPEPDRTVGQVAKDALWEGAGFGNVAKVAKTAYGAGKDLYQGTQATVGQTGEDFDKPKFIKGITQLVSGGSKTAIALSAPELMELGAAADAGHIGAQGAIIKILAAAEAGNIASDVGGAASDKLNLSPETKDLIQTAAFFLPTLAGAMKFKGGAGVDAQGNPGIGVSSKGGGFRAGAVGTPEAFDIRAQVGDTRVGVKIPRGGQPAPPPPDPAQVLQAQQTDAGTNAIIRAATKQKQAATVVAGGPPPPPPGPKLPAAMQDGVVSPQTVQDIATMIHLSPVEQHPKLIMEAHGKLAEYIQKQGRIIDPDGKLQIAETPQQAAKLAANIINNEVDRQQTAKEDAAKQQEQVAKEQEKAAKEANKPGEDGALSPADQQWARAKTIIESTTLQPGQKITSVLQRNLGVGYGTANEMMQRYQKEQTEAALPTVGGKGHEVVEESRATVDAQLEAMKRGDTNVVMLPEGSKYMPKVPDGMKMMSVTGDSPGAGKYLYNPQNIRAATIKEAAKAGTHGDLLGHIQPKSEIAAAPEKQTVVVQAQDKATGTPIQDSEVHPERVEQQKEVMKERHPDAKIVVKPTHEVLIDRLEAQQEEPKTDIFDEAAKPERELTPLEKHGPLISKSLQTGKVTVIPEPAETAPAKEVAKSTKEENLAEKAKEPEAAGSQRGVAPAAPETKSYQAEVQKYAGAKSRIEKVDAENRRHAETLLREKFPGEVVASAERASPEPAKEVAKKEVTPISKGDTVTFKDRTGKMQTGTIAHAGDRMVRVKVDGKEYTTFRGGVKPVAEVSTKEDNKPNEPGPNQSGAGRETSPAGSGDRAPLAERPAEVLPTPAEREPTEAAGKPDSPSVLDRIESVPGEGDESGSGSRTDSGIDSAPGLAETEKATKALTKPVVLNKNWFAHPADFAVPPGEMGKLDGNIRALEILRDLEKNPHRATPEEKIAMAQFAGWGSLPNVFRPYSINDHQKRMRFMEAARKLKDLLSPEEMQAAERSTQNAHYTSPEVVRWIWDIAKRVGFRAGTILEPSMGSGNFLGMMPKALRNSSFAIGNEMEPVTYAIAKQLYPDAQLYNKDFKDLILADNSVDLAISNVPFGGSIYDPKYSKLKAQIHDYFFVKALDKVRPGGVVAFITGTGSMDARGKAIREILASKADLLAAFRLPSTAFKATAGTSVTTDLILLRKRAPGQPAKGEAWVNSVETQVPNDQGAMQTLHVNEYYKDHPDNLLGKPLASSMYSDRDDRFSLDPHTDESMADLMDAAFKRVPIGSMEETKQGSQQADTAAAFAPDNLQEGQYIVKDGKLLQRAQGKLVKPPIVTDKFGTVSLRKIERLKDLVSLRDELNDLLTQMKVSPNDDANNAIIARQRGALKKEYDAFVKKNGLLNAPVNNLFEDDPHYPRLLALENYDRATRVATPADIFSKRTIFPRETLTSVSPDPQEALQQILGESGFPDVGLIAKLQGKSAAEVAKALIDKNLVYKDPLSGKYETPTNYLSGYVRDKLADATAAVEQGNKEYQRNVDALTKAVPETIPIKDVNIRLGQTWIPTRTIENFIQDKLSSPSTVSNVAGLWKVDNVRPTVEATTLYGTPKRHADELMTDMLNQKQTTVNFPPNADGSSGGLDVDATNAARAMQEKIAKDFHDYASEHPTWGPHLEKAYNYTYNNLVRAEFDGSHLTFPGMNPAIKLNAHQVNLVWQLLQEGRGFVAHTVGAGKTFEIVAAVMESRRLGLAKKQMIAVPNHLVGQWRKEFMLLYPGATLLVPTKDDFNAKNRNKIMAKIATGDFDAVILPHSQFDLMDISPERMEKTMQGELDELRETIRALESQRGTENKRTVKQMQKSMDALRTRMDKLKDLKADKTINFDEMGVDRLYVDEAHEYKNLAFYTKMQRVSGLGQSSSKKGTRLLAKTQYLQDTYNGRGVIFASGTPVQNTMAELYSQNKYVAPDILQKAGIKFFDDWAANFGEAITSMELSADGRSYKARTKFAKFVNVPELMQMFRAFTDVKTKADLNLPVPKLKDGKETIITVAASDAVDEYVKELMDRALAVSGKKGAKPDPSVDNMLKITSDGRKAATDMRLVDAKYPDDPDSKINQAVEEIFRTYREASDVKGTQAVFLDMFRAYEERVDGAKPKTRLNLYHDMRDKLLKLGMKPDQIAIINEAKTKEDKQRMFDQMNSGVLRVIFGSTKKMGAGMNAQTRMIRLHNVDLPWRPGDLEQRRGRIERQGNLNPVVDVSNYLTTKSFDAYMAQTLQTKAEFIHQVMTGKYHGRTMIDAAGEQVMSAEEMKIAASGNPAVKQKMELERRLVQLQSLQRSEEAARRATQQRIAEAQGQVARNKGRLAAVESAAAKYAEAVGKDGEGYQLDVDGQKFTDKETAFEYLKAMEVPPGNFYLTMNGQGVSVMRTERLGEEVLRYNLPYTGDETFDAPKMAMESLGRSIDQRLRSLPDRVGEMLDSIKVAEERAAKLKQYAEGGKSDQADELKEVQAELKKVNVSLGIGKSDLDGDLAMTQAVTAEADNTGQTQDEAEDEEESKELSNDDDHEDEEKPPSKGVVLRSSFFGAEKLVEFMADQGQKLWEKDVAPHIPGAVEGFKRAATQTAALLYPRIGANQDALDSLFKAKGEREKARFMLDRMEGGLEKFFDKMPEAARLAFIDRYKMGVGQLDPTLQKIETLMRAIDKATFDRAQVYKPSMTAKEDHYRVLWKVIPDPSGTHGNPTANTSRVGQGRRPFEGDKGFMKRATLDTISEGIHYGGVPVSTNPWKMFTLAQQSMLQYITAQDHWRDLKKLGLRKFVKPGQKRPDGWVKLDDRIAKSFFPASSGEGMVQAGEWYLEPSAGRTLNNYLSRDLVRENAIGKVLMAAKNISTMIELGLSPFHFGFETVEAMGSQFGLGVQRLWNNGIRLGEGTEAMKGVKEIATSMAAPVLMARTGGSLLKMVDNLQNFAKTKRGASFLQQHPDAPAMMDDLFTGGYQWGMNPDFKVSMMKSMRQAITDKNYGGAMLRLMPWANEVIMSPLFEHYIPRLKLGFALAQYSQQLVENRTALANGDTTRAAIARKVIDTAENRFGEMNFSNILWNNTFKSVAQFNFRSVTWKLGNWRGAGSAAGPEAYHAFADPIQAMIEDAKAGKKQRPAGEYVPKIGMNQAWLLGMAAATVVLGTILTKLWTEKYPWEFAEGDDGHLLLEMTHPRTGQVDARTGKPERISLPTGFKDFEHAYLHPREYVRGSMSGTAGNFVDLLENRDFFNNYVYDPNAPLYQQVAEAVKYSLPKPIAAQGFTDKHGGQSTMTKVLKTSGLSPTSRERDLTPAEQRMQEILRARRTPLTPQQVKDRQDQDAIVKTPTVRSMHMALKAGHTEYIQKEFKNMSYADAREVYNNLATPAERRILKPEMDKKRMNLLRRNPEAVRRADANP